MIPWERLDNAPVPGGGELRLMRRSREYSIMLGTNELMNSRLSGSEEALATESFARIAPGAKPAILIGGLGMGFTLRAALAAAPPDAAITVMELVPAVIRWARGPMAELFAGSMDDARVTVTEGDVGAAIRGSAGGYHAILLDVDNGPDGLTREGNDALYDAAGLAAARRALLPGGILAVWSAHPDDAFRRRFSQAGFTVEELRVKANRGRAGARHVIWLGRRSMR